ncbi:MAG: restriction endonuclease subunit R, partial [Spirochaetia bacterium]|nr:restriction endonuclease subunit R [Spirochaetia bacterium]
TTPIERQRRVELVRQEIMIGLTPNQNEFVDFVLKQYILKGYKELSLQNLPELIKLKYGTVNEAKPVLGSIGEINKLFVGFQQSLYTA